MATKTWTGTGTWATAGSWTPAGVPAAGDDVVFNAASAACTVGANTNALLSLTCTGYVNTLTINANLIIAGNVTLSSGMTTLGTGNLDISANSTIVSAGHTLGVNLRFITINTTIQLADAMVLSKGITAFGTPAGSIALRSSTPLTRRGFTLVNNGTTTQYVDYLNVTDLDSSAACTLWTYKGTITNCNNWFLMPSQPPPVSGISFG
jgi:hypothetical protein